jgi:hypothetical protein
VSSRRKKPLLRLHEMPAIVMHDSDFESNISILSVAAGTIIASVSIDRQPSASAMAGSGKPMIESAIGLVPSMK